MQPATEVSTQSVLVPEPSHAAPTPGLRLADLSYSELCARIELASNTAPEYWANRGADMVAMLAEKSRREEAAEPLLRAKRLRSKAASLDASGDRLAAQAAEFFGKAAHRRQQGEPDLAQGYQAQADAAEQLSVERHDQAADLRAEARRIENRASNAAALALVVGGLS